MSNNVIRGLSFTFCLIAIAISVAASDQPNEISQIQVRKERIENPTLNDYGKETALRPFNENSEGAYSVDVGSDVPMFNSEAHYNPESLTIANSEVNSQLEGHQQSEVDENDGILNPITAAVHEKGETEDDTLTRNRRIIVVYPHFDFEDEHDHGYGHKKGHGGYGYGSPSTAYGHDYGHKKGYGSSTHYHPETKYGHDSHGYGYGYGGKAKKYYRRLRGPLSPILNWYYFGYL